MAGGRVLGEDEIVSFLATLVEIVRGRTVTKSTYVIFADRSGKRTLADGTTLYLSGITLLSHEDYNSLDSRLKEIDSKTRQKASLLPESERAKTYKDGLREATEIFEECLSRDLSKQSNEYGVFAYKERVIRGGIEKEVYRFSSRVEGGSIEFVDEDREEQEQIKTEKDRLGIKDKKPEEKKEI